VLGFAWALGLSPITTVGPFDTVEAAQLATDEVWRGEVGVTPIGRCGRVYLVVGSDHRRDHTASMVDGDELV
jgi:hypothetical protein